MSSDAVSSTPVAFRLRWDVFLSFRGEDTRHTITRNLYDSLQRHGVRVFLDDDGLDRGDEIAPRLLEAIDDSAAAVVILSENYASSHWCLEELAKICECKRLILPVFYRVDPSDVRRQRGPFSESFKNLELDGRFGGKIGRWRDAMAKVGGFAGYPFTNNSKEEDLVKRVVKKVLAELSNTPIGVATYRVGLDSRVEELVKKLDVKSNGSQILVLCGPGGVGKTTLAKALYNKLVSRFEHRSFISNVRENSAKDNGLVSLQNKVMGDLSSSGTAPPVNEVNAGIRAIKNVVHENRVLVVYDDVNNVNQLEALAGIGDWYYKGSVVIITTRDTEVLREDQVNILHEVRELNSDEALQLFSYHALGREKPSAEFFNLSEKIVSLTGGLPLALEVFGSFLFDKRTTKDWQDALQKLKQIRPRQIHDVLKISYDDLDEQVKCIFLDIACFFVKMEMRREEAIDILKGCGFRVEIAVTVLVAKSLVKIIEGNTLWMHDQIREMGNQIVQHENLLDPGMRSRLWNRDEIITVLKDSKGTRSVEGIILDFESKNFVNELSGVRLSWENFRRQINFSTAYTYLEERYKKYLQDRTEKEREVILRTKPFEAMVNLRLLQINYVKVEGSFKFLSAGLKWLQWKGCPLKTLPSDFCPRGLAVLDLSKSKIERVWGSFSNKVAENLLVMNLGGCYNLIDIPDLSGHQRLEKLILERCNGLIRIHESIGNVSTLLHLNLRECSNLTCFPSNVSGLKHLENFVLSGCSELKELPEDIGSMKSLKVLLADGTAISKLPESIFHLTNLEKLSLDDCLSLTRLPGCIGKLISLKELSLAGSSIEELPYSVGSLANLEKLYLTWCKSLAALPDSVGNLKLLTEIFMNQSAIKELPASIGLLPFLKNLSVGHCRSLVGLPNSIEGLASMVELELDGTSITDLPPQIGTLKMLEKLEMRNCTSLKSLPESIGNIWTLTTLIISSAKITEFPESIGMLENLNMLSVNKCKQLCKIPASIGNLKSLYHLLMEDTAVTELPESFGRLSSLVRLKMAKKPQSEMPGENDKDVVLPSSFSKLSSLIELDARAWKLSGKISDDFERLTSLEVLNLGKNKISSLPPSLRSMSTLEKLFLPHCKELESLPLLPSSLLELNASNCTVLENIPDLSNLKNLQELNLTNCEKLADIPGLECLESLRRLYMSGCSACSAVVNRRVSKASLKKLSYLSMPGSKIPDWFSQDAVTFSECKNRALKAVIICVVISVNHQIPDDLRDELPGIVDVQGSITQLNKPIYSAALNLEGVPNTDEDQFHLCRYPESHPFVSKLKDGYKIQVRKQPIVKGVELKKSGIHLVLEGADDYDGDEESLDPSQHSVSQKLTKFFNSFEENNSISISESGYEVAANTLEEAEEINKRISAKCTNYYVSGFIVLPLILLIMSWLFYHLPVEHH